MKEKLFLSSSVNNMEPVFIAAEYCSVVIEQLKEDHIPSSRYFLQTKEYFETKDGLLNKPLSTAFYLAAKKEMCGSTDYERSLINEHLLLANDLQKSKKEDVLKSLDKVLLSKTYLLTERISISDIVVFCSFSATPDKTFYPNLFRWYETCKNQKEFKQGLENKEIFSTKNKKKEKLSFELLPQSTFILDEWKRVYSNKETRSEAIPWFNENIDWEGYSLWRIDYKYNDELKKIFMSCNLMTGLFNRMDFLRKYCFGTFLLFGKDDENEISGYILLRGKNLGEMTEVPDYDSYTFKKVDVNNKKEMTLFEDYLAWDGTFEGCTKEFNQGKIFK